VVKKKKKKTPQIEDKMMIFKRIEILKYLSFGN